jgi:hypothetical protein
MAETQCIWSPECLNIPARSSPKRSLRQVKQLVDTYTSKVVQFDSDIKRAFDGIQGSLEMSWGIPVSCMAYPHLPSIGRYYGSDRIRRY